MYFGALCRLKSDTTIFRWILCSRVQYPKHELTPCWIVGGVRGPWESEQEARDAVIAISDKPVVIHR